MEDDHMTEDLNKTALVQPTEETASPAPEESGSDTAVSEPAVSEPAEKKPKRKKTASKIFDIIVICVLMFGLYDTYTSQMRETFDDIAKCDASDILSELKDVGVSYTLEVADEKLPQVEQYSWKELREGGGKPAMMFQMLTYNESFPDIFKTGRRVNYLDCIRTVKVYITSDGAASAQYVGDVDVSIQAFWQGLGKKGALYFDNAVPDANLEKFISRYADAQEQALFESSFTVQGSNVDYYNEAITIYYDWTNPWNEELGPMGAFSLTAYQNGRELRQDYFNSETDPIISTLEPGSTASYSVVYYLRDTSSPVKLVVANRYGHFFEDDPPAMEFEISI